MSNELAIPSDMIPGLEDVGETGGGGIPRLRINMKRATFEDSESGEQHGEITVVCLGVVRQRILWPEEMNDDNTWLCRSRDGHLGLPNGDDFPAEAAGVSGDQVSCEDCNLKEWDSHPTKNIPWCTEQLVIPSIMPYDNGATAPVILTFQRSSMKAARQYVNSFARAGQPMFTHYTTIKLIAARRGATEYAVPEFSKGDATPDKFHERFVEQWREISEFLRTPPPEAETAVEVTETATSTTTVEATAVEDGEEIPF